MKSPSLHVWVGIHRRRRRVACIDLFDMELIDVLQLIQLCDALATLQSQLSSHCIQREPRACKCMPAGQVIEAGRSQYGPRPVMILLRRRYQPECLKGRVLQLTDCQAHRGQDNTAHAFKL